MKAVLFFRVPVPSWFSKGRGLDSRELKPSGEESESTQKKPTFYNPDDIKTRTLHPPWRMKGAAPRNSKSLNAWARAVRCASFSIS
jgi:hypothetical protein